MGASDDGQRRGTLPPRAARMVATLGLARPALPRAQVVPRENRVLFGRIARKVIGLSRPTRSGRPPPEDDSDTL